MSHVWLNQGLQAAAARHPRPPEFKPSYGTAGFRATASLLDSTLFRCGVLAGLRAQQCAATVGLMVTASHNPEPDNGVKMVESNGEMLVPVWESHATAVANASTDQELIDALQKVIETESISQAGSATVVIGGDTRPHTHELMQAACEGVELTGARVLNIGTCTTPVLHYSVLLQNQSDLAPYEERLVKAFQALTEGCADPEIEIAVDCANGVGAVAPASLFTPVDKPDETASPGRQRFHMPGHGLRLRILNSPPSTPGHAGPTGLNDHCGSDHVQTQMAWPRGLDPAEAAEVACCASLDGDADRIIFYCSEQPSGATASNQAPQIIDGDYIAALVATFAHELIADLPTTDNISLGVIQTAYANGAATEALRARGVSTELALTGVKHLHEAAKAFDVGIYFEANGHGSVLFSPRLLQLLQRLEADVCGGGGGGISAEQKRAVQSLRAFEQIVNPAVGDAWSNLLLVAAILKRRRMLAADWRALYAPLATRLAVVRVADRAAVRTTAMDTRTTAPAGLQEAVDGAVAAVPHGRAFVRPSGTQDVVRVYAEAGSQAQADALALQVMKLVHGMADGVGDAPTAL
eukprot:jgi/Ulvmu1/8400/UM042_0107.1